MLCNIGNIHPNFQSMIFIEHPFTSEVEITVSQQEQGQICKQRAYGYKETLKADKRRKDSEYYSQMLNATVFWSEGSYFSIFPNTGTSFTRLTTRQCQCITIFSCINQTVPIWTQQLLAGLEQMPLRPLETMPFIF